MNTKTECLGNVFIVAAPSGGGKTSLIKRLLEILEGIEVSISHTTRAPRPGEIDGVDYFFVQQTRFIEMIAQNAFIEHAQVFDSYYGTSVTQIQQRLEAGIDVVLDIDWQGAQQIKKIFPQAKGIFVLPPSLAVLKERLSKRGQDNQETIDYRMQGAQAEIMHFNEFDYLIVNEHFEQAVQDLQAIVVADRLSIQRQMRKIKKTISAFIHL